jgi:large subunit ribosomal protein L12
MEYVYSALLLHAAGKKIDEEGIKKVLEASGIKPDQAKIKALVSSLADVNIDDAIKQAPVATTAAPVVPEEKKEEAKEEKKEEEKKKVEEAAEGLSSLFG